MHGRLKNGKRTSGCGIHVVHLQAKPPHLRNRSEADFKTPLRLAPTSTLESSLRAVKQCHTLHIHNETRQPPHPPRLPPHRRLRRRLGPSFPRHRHLNRAPPPPTPPWRNALRRLHLQQHHTTSLVRAAEFPVLSALAGADPAIHADGRVTSAFRAREVG